MNDRQPFVLDSLTLASLLNGIAEKLVRRGNIHVEYDDDFYWMLDPDDAPLNVSKEPPVALLLAAASDSGDYFKSFDADDDEMLGADLWQLSELLAYLHLVQSGAIRRARGGRA